MTTVERVLEVARGHRPLSFTDPSTYGGELLAALALDGLDVRGDCRVFGGRVDLLVAHLDTVAVLVCPPGHDADAVVVRRLRRLAAGGDVDALILLAWEERHLGIERFEFPCPVHVELIAGSGAETTGEAFAA